MLIVITSPVQYDLVPRHKQTGNETPHSLVAQLVVGYTSASVVVARIELVRASIL